MSNTSVVVVYFINDVLTYSSAFSVPNLSSLDSTKNHNNSTNVDTILWIVYSMFAAIYTISIFKKGMFTIWAKISWSLVAVNNALKRFCKVEHNWDVGCRVLGGTKISQLFLWSADHSFVHMRHQANLTIWARIAPRTTKSIMQWQLYAI